MEKDAYISTPINYDASKDSIAKKTINMILILFFLILSLIVLGSIGLEAFKKGERTVESEAKQYAQKSRFNMACNQLLNKLRTGEIEPQEVAIKIRTMNHKHSKLIASGILLFDKLKTRVEQEKSIGYNEIKSEMSEFQFILNELRGMNDLSEKSLYMAFIARDLMIYIFKNRKIFSIHIEDKIISDSDKKVMKSFYQDVFSVYDCIKQFSNKEFYNDATNFDLLAIGLYVMAIDVTESVNDDDKINQILNKIHSEDFNFSGPRGEWYNWLPGELIKVKTNYTRFMVKHEPPYFAEGYWLR